MLNIDIDLTPEQYYIAEELQLAVARQLHVKPTTIGHVQILKRSLDSRRGIKYHTSANIYRSDETFVPPVFKSDYQDCSHAEPVVIVGAGPAGLFAALRALELGIKPIIIERGKPVDERKRDIALLGREGVVNPDSNWCFGEGGAGTFSDGKLYTRSTKRGNVDDILRKFVEHGASPDIMIDAHAHIGTDRLSPIIAQIRQTILNHGGEYHFGSQVSDFLLKDNTVYGVVTSDGQEYEGRAVVLATGHSARDIYELFHKHGWSLEAKPFAMGVRVEHPQSLIDSIQYHTKNRSPYLPPAAYNLTTQVRTTSDSQSGCTHGVFSFCMCPGGVIVPAATADNQQVVNGMSNSQRNSPFANSGIAVTIDLRDVPDYVQYGPLALLRFQQDVERKMFLNGAAPSQRLTDFCESRTSSKLNKSNYLGKCESTPLHETLPPTVVEGLQQGFRDFDRKMHGFYTSEASVLAVESRTSSPVRIPRGPDYQHIQLRNLYPCGEGAGYSGGIVSSAIDGINCINAIMMRNA